MGSSGLHSNGYSLARKVLLEIDRMNLAGHVEEFGRTLGEELLEPTKHLRQGLPRAGRRDRTCGRSATSPAVDSPTTSLASCRRVWSPNSTAAPGARLRCSR